MKKDVIVDEVRRVREELLKEHGGLAGWIEHLQEMDRKRALNSKRRTTKGAKPAAQAKRSKPKKSRLD